MQIGKSLSNNITGLTAMNKLIQLLFVALISAFITFASNKYHTHDKVVSTEEMGYKMY